ncbi:hypothetical protein PENTCL1PPCAC_11972 [Pristionchus entomophagus]|uniref:Beta-glucuronidase n=1 Tax=Pristionchus entomophagus TaxID=358040 RepID=A0AAV5T4A5_9BILA|nr:hypothetical protein PENTCL1PPCAC_11972 [Pristionchus entomophagus]
MLQTLTLLLLSPLSLAILPVQENEIREVRQLNDLWTFVREPSNSIGYGLKHEWFRQDISTFHNATVMPVPSAFNDLQDSSLRDHVGWVWYQRSEFIPSRMSKGRTYIRFDSANYYAKVFINTIETGANTGGHLPFEFDITQHIVYGQKSTITVAINNTLSLTTLPQGDVKPTGYPDHIYQRGFMDFFPYSGLLRSVRLLFLPKTHITGQSIIADAEGSLSFTNDVIGTGFSKVEVIVTDADGEIEYTSSALNGTGKVAKPELWWPRNMGKPYLYTITVRLLSDSGSLIDVIRTKFGFRSITWTKSEILWNGRPFYCQGFGMHEEYDVRGRSFDSVMMTRDLNLVEWTGANCYRTSHYPYSEERMEENDRRGIAVIVETAAVAIRHYSDSIQNHHMDFIRATIDRDRNHPSAFMWSLANEPSSSLHEAKPYFVPLVKLAKSLDTTRPITVVLASGPATDVVADLLDVICFNRYYGWYSNIGMLFKIEADIYNEISIWNKKFARPILISEYGAEAIPGMHRDPPFAFTEEYQVEVLKEHHKAFDRLRNEKRLAGEMVWVFADFMTLQDTTRVVGNHKGLFTRQREPKMSAHLIRQRYSTNKTRHRDEL